MSATNSPRSVRAATRPTRVRTVCIVDPCQDDYQGWEALAQADGVRLEIVASANEALRLSHADAIDLWVINTTLPQLSGYELCSMLKSQRPPAAIYLVADEYSAEAECAAWRARATLFGCKGSHVTWLREWLDSTPGRIQPHFHPRPQQAPQRSSTTLE